MSTLAVRPYNHNQDFTTHQKWHLMRFGEDGLDRGIPLMPKTALVVVSASTEEPIAMGGFIRTDYYGLVICEAYAANPLVEKELRALALLKLNQSLMALAKQLGYETFMGVTAVNSVKEHGILMDGEVHEGYSVIVGKVK